MPEETERPPRLRISEIFLSIQGESRAAGVPTVFVRLTGCPLRCSWCDTTYSFTGGQSMELNSILGMVADLGVPHVCVTGGEPLAQAACRTLLADLCEQGHVVQLETSGALDVSGIDPRVTIVMDCKTPSSGESERNLWENLEVLRMQDQVKFVIADRKDYLWSVDVLQRHALEQRCSVLFSPVWEAMEPRQLAEWILADRLPVRFQVQLHKLLWGTQRGH